MDLEFEIKRLEDERRFLERKLSDNTYLLGCIQKYYDKEINKEKLVKIIQLNKPNSKSENNTEKQRKIAVEKNLNKKYDDLNLDKDTDLKLSFITEHLIFNTTLEYTKKDWLKVYTPDYLRDMTLYTNMLKKGEMSMENYYYRKTNVLWKYIQEYEFKKKIEEENLKLTIELVPSTSWFNNVRSNVSEEQWNVIRKKSYELAGHKCEICGDVGTNQGAKHKVECHEIWDYDDNKLEQKLIGFISLCVYCHKVKHAGLSIKQGKRDVVMNQLMKVNEITEQQARKLISYAFHKHEERSKHDWKVNIDYIDEFIKQ